MSISLRFRNIVGSLAGIFLLSIHAEAAQIYVDWKLSAPITNGTYSVAYRNTSGRDGNAYISIKDAVKEMKAGDTMLIRGGSYVERNIYIGDWRSGSPDAWYTVKSYPGEWAVIDGQHNPQLNDFSHSILYGTTANGMQGYIKFENLEITGAGYDTNHREYPSLSGAGIAMRGGPFVFRGLYVHHNYGDSSSNSAGLKLENGTGGSLIEFCRFKGNGEVRTNKRNTSVSNLTIYSDYMYAKKVELKDPKTGYYTASAGNEIRYCLFEGAAGRENFTTTGFKHKAFQRLTGYNFADQRNASDEQPNGSELASKGDKIHHNIFLGHMVGIEVDQDYVQIYNNILVMKNWWDGPENAIQVRDENTARRGPYKPTIYNNTILAGGLRGIIVHMVPDGWKGVVPYIKCYIYSNIIQNARGDYDSEDLSIESDGVTATGGFPLSDLHVSRNYFYQPPDSNLIYIHTTKYTKQAIERTSAADKVYCNMYDERDPLYAGAFGSSRFKTRAQHSVGDGKTVINGGIGGKHPYLSEVVLPSYIGATNPIKDSGRKWDFRHPDPDDSGWVDFVLEDVGNLPFDTR